MSRKQSEFFTHPEDRPESPPTVNSFDVLVQQLGLTPEEYPFSEELRAWVQANKNERYVPPELLAVWGLRVKV